ncbi:MAG: choice-of-anchor B family protein [Saprospiraceae bacterium]
MKNYFKLFLCAGLTLTLGTAMAQNYNLELRSTLSFPGQTLANICGYTQDGREYALLGASKGMIIVDITNPDMPQQIVQIPGPDNLWKEIKTYDHYAYVTSEGGQGLQIVDLSNLPNSTLNSHFYTGDGVIQGGMDKIHALHIDVKKGYLYTFGGDLFQGGAKILDLNSDPYNPSYVGKYDQLGYVHDGFAENDTLYAAHIYTGILAIVDMADKSNPKVLGTATTPGHFTHNAWLLDDHKHILTTDEEFASFVTAFDISNPEDIQELDRISTTRDGVNSIGHNTHVRNDWAITSWYTDGVTIVDAHRPDNLVEVARYDTYATPVNLSDPFEGCWGAFPFFPSGTIVTSNITPAVFNLFTPTYVRACYLEGTVLNGCNGFPLNGANIEVNTPEIRVDVSSKTNGVFKTGQVTPGDYVATISKPGFVTQNIPFSFVTGQVATINVTMVPEAVSDYSGVVLDAITQQSVPNAFVELFSATQSFDLAADADGKFDIDCILTDNYQATAGAWGYLSNTVSLNGSTSANIMLQRGYYDDFQLDLGWTTSATASSGFWELGDPVGTYGNQNNLVNPEFDANGDNNQQCYVTGNGASGNSVGGDDVDDGSVTLISPAMDLTGFSNGTISFYYWFYNGFGQGTPNDELAVNVLVNGQSYPVFIETVSGSTWRFSGDIALPAQAFSSNDVKVEFVATDNDPGHVTEAGVDIFKVELTPVSGTQNPFLTASIQAAPNPTHSDFILSYNLGNTQDAAVLEVRNLLGQLMYTQPVDTKTGRIQCGGNWTPGVYFASIHNGNAQSLSLKLVKE